MAGDIGQIQVGRPPSGVRPVAPIAPSPAPAAAPIVIPSGKAPGRSRIILVVVSIIAVIGIIIAVILSFTGGTSTPTPTPEPTTTATLTPVSPLASYFGTAVDSGTGTTPSAGDFLNISGWPSFSTPDAVSAVLAADSAWLRFGQTEVFDANGNPQTGTAMRIVLVREVSGAAAAGTAVRTWEGASMSDDLSQVFGYDTAQVEADAVFHDATRGATSISYQNYPYADSSLDWAIVTASNGKSYLVIAGSRQSMFAAIDTLTQ